MIKAIERFGDRLLTTVVPRVTASADPCNGCRTGQKKTFQCYCDCGAGSLGTRVLQDCTCNGCNWSCGSCHVDWSSICVC